MANQFFIVIAMVLVWRLKQREGLNILTSLLSTQRRFQLLDLRITGKANWVLKILILLNLILKGMN